MRIALLAGLGIGIAPCLTAGTGVGDRFPSLVNPAAGLEGTGAPAEGRVMLVDFWASWCAPCKASFPAYTALDQEYRSRGLAIVAVSVDQNPAAYAEFVKRMHPSFVTLRDKDHQLVSLVDVPAMPTCFLIGRDGRVRFIHAGFHGAETDRELRREIDAVLAEKPNSP